MIGPDTFSALAPVLAPYLKNWLCHPLPVFMTVSMIPKYVTFELLLRAAFVAEEIWGYMLEPARTGVRDKNETCLYRGGRGTTPVSRAVPQAKPLTIISWLSRKLKAMVRNKNKNENCS